MSNSASISKDDRRAGAVKGARLKQMRTARTLAPREKTSCFRVIANMRGEFLFGETSDIDGHDDSLFVRGVAEIRPVKSNGASSVSRHRDANEISIRDNAVGGVEFNPAGVGQINSTPGTR